MGHASVLQRKRTFLAVVPSNEGRAGELRAAFVAVVVLRSPASVLERPGGKGSDTHECSRQQECIRLFRKAGTVRVH